MADSSTNKFFLDTNDSLGFAYQEYVADIRALALSKPAEYFQLRKENPSKKMQCLLYTRHYSTFFPLEQRYKVAQSVD
jgi:ribonucleotide reductase beta subunit family protein with ferritin-like domain